MYTNRSLRVGVIYDLHKLPADLNAAKIEDNHHLVMFTLSGLCSMGSPTTVKSVSI